MRIREVGVGERVAARSDAGTPVVHATGPAGAIPGSKGRKGRYRPVGCGAARFTAAWRAPGRGIGVRQASADEGSASTKIRLGAAGRMGGEEVGALQTRGALNLFDAGSSPACLAGVRRVDAFAYAGVARRIDGLVARLLDGG